MEQNRGNDGRIQKLSKKYGRSVNIDTNNIETDVTYNAVVVANDATKNLLGTTNFDANERNVIWREETKIRRIKYDNPIIINARFL